MADELSQYVPVLMLLVLAILFSLFMLVGSALLGKRGGRNRLKDIAYECGKVPVGEGAPRMSVKFYLVAMLFILFDIEIFFMYPWAVVYRDFLAQHGPVIFWSMAGFVSVLTIGYVYAIKKGALVFNKCSRREVLQFRSR